MADGLDRMSVAGVELEVRRRGAGRPLVLLHGFAPVAPDAPFLDLLGAHAAVVAPTHPGFGHTARPHDLDSVYDLVRLYLELLDRLPGERVTLMGLSFGGWLAAEIAVACPHRLAALVLVDAVGIKVSDRETPDILDVFNTSPAEVQRRSWHDLATWRFDPDAMTDEALVAHARNRDALCLYAWHPYMYSPKLARWLGRIRVPTLVLWGAHDGIVSPAYGRAYSARIPGARFETIEAAGHHPEIEQPKALVQRVLAFLEEGPCRPGT
jgi:pimeloyl-ACP methyl ester carboxylesterase